MNILEYKKTLTVVGAISMAVSGACWGYVVAYDQLENELETKLTDILDMETDRIKRYYETRYKADQPEDYSELDDDEVVVDQQHIVIPKEALTTPEGRAQVMAQISEAIEPGDARELVGEDRFESEEVGEEAPEPMNAFEETALYEERDGEKPYIISKEEYDRNDAKYPTYEVTFFEGDGVLIDEDDDAIPDTDGVVGDKNLQRFGIWSKDNNVVYVQNDQTEALFRITRSSQSAQEALYGLPDEDELAHSSMGRRRPRRGTEWE